MPIEISGKATSNIRVLDSKALSSGVRSSSIQTPNIAPHPTRLAADSISLTGTAAYLRQLENRLSTLPVIDIQRTESIKKALADGHFVINPARVADKLLRFESMFYYHAT